VQVTSIDSVSCVDSTGWRPKTNADVLWYTSAPAFASGTVFAEPMLFPLTPCSHNNEFIIPLYHKLLTTTKADGRGVERVQLIPIPSAWYQQARDKRGGTPKVRDLFLSLVADGLLPLGLLRGGQRPPTRTRTHGAAEFWTEAASYVLPCPNVEWPVQPDDSVYVLVSSEA